MPYSSPTFVEIVTTRFDRSPTPSTAKILILICGLDSASSCDASPGHSPRNSSSCLTTVYISSCWCVEAAGSVKCLESVLNEEAKRHGEKWSAWLAEPAQAGTESGSVRKVSTSYKRILSTSRTLFDTISKVNIAPRGYLWSFNHRQAAPFDNEVNETCSLLI